MGRPGSSADHYALRDWVDVGAVISRSEVDASGTSVGDRCVGGEDIVRWGGSTTRSFKKIEFAATAQPKLALSTLAGPACNKRKASHPLFFSFHGLLGLLCVAVFTRPLHSKL